jgi:hypothetical protein
MRADLYKAAIRALAPTSSVTDCDPDFQAGAARIADSERWIAVSGNAGARTQIIRSCAFLACCG